MQIKFIIPILVLGLFSCEQKKSSVNTEKYPVTTALRIDTHTFIDYVAEIKAIQNVEIRAKAAGFLYKVHVDEGQYVSSGQLLFSIDDRAYKEEMIKKRALLKVAQSNVKNADLELQRTKSLVDKGVVSKIELEFAKNQLEAAKAKEEEARSELSHAQLNLSYTKIKAPFSGIINRLPCKIGSLVENGTLLTNISQNDEVFAYFDVSEQEYLNLRSMESKLNNHKGKALLVLANGQEYESPGYIETMEGEIDHESGNIAFRARFKNQNGLLKHGASGKVRIEKNFKNVLVIPQKSTFEIQDKTFVYVVNKRGKIESREVKIAYRIPHLYIIDAGLLENESFVFEGIQAIRDGMEIKTKTLQPRQIIQDFSKR